MFSFKSEIFSILLNSSNFLKKLSKLLLSKTRPFFLSLINSIGPVLQFDVKVGVLQKDASIKLLNSINERAALLEKTGLDYLIIHPFSKEFSRLKALDFVRDILVNQLNTAKLIIGYDHHFGKNREGNIEQLTEYSQLYDFSVEEIPVQDVDEVAVSSTKIRKALANGALKTANKYLGNNFSLGDASSF